jgi:hypothetical protein
MTDPINKKLASALANTSELNESDLEDTGKSRREYPRRNIRWKARLITSQKVLMEGETINVSQKGAMINLPVNLIEGDVVLVDIRAFFKGTACNIKAKGIVKHNYMSSEGVHVGIYFKETTPKADAFLEKFTTGTL